MVQGFVFVLLLSAALAVAGWLYGFGWLTEPFLTGFGLGGLSVWAAFIWALRGAHSADPRPEVRCRCGCPASLHDRHYCAGCRAGHVFRRWTP